VSGRPQVPDLERLCYRVWVRMLRIHPEVRRRCDAGADVPARGAWARLVPLLFPDLDFDGMERGHLQGLMGIVREGNDPRRLIRRFEYSMLTPEALQSLEKLPGLKFVERRRSGYSSRRPGDQPIAYVEVPLDLVARGEIIAPGSSDWLYAPFWDLGKPTLPRLEDIRAGLLQLKHRLGLCNPSPAELSPFLEIEETARLAAQTLEEQKTAYRESILPLAREPTPDSISLLAGLVAETFTTDQGVLHAIHCDAFALAMERLLQPPILRAVARDFEMLVGARILLGSWELPAFFHVPSLDAPFRTLKEMEQLTQERFGLSTWGGS
jgi:hypothetical protein